MFIQGILELELEFDRRDHPELDKTSKLEVI
jgi:hypothetical protein